MFSDSYDLVKRPGAVYLIPYRIVNGNHHFGIFVNSLGIFRILGGTVKPTDDNTFAALAGRLNEVCPEFELTQEDLSLASVFTSPTTSYLHQLIGSHQEKMMSLNISDGFPSIRLKVYQRKISVHP